MDDSPIHTLVPRLVADIVTAIMMDKSVGSHDSNRGVVVAQPPPPQKPIVKQSLFDALLRDIPPELHNAGKALILDKWARCESMALWRNQTPA